MLRAKELYEESIDLFKQGKYQSANNRAYYCIEKSLKGLLASIGKDSKTHNGVLQVFNLEFIHEKNNSMFDKEDYKLCRSVENIRNASDYDDFFEPSAEETREAIQIAGKMHEKCRHYLIDMGFILELN